MVLLLEAMGKDVSIQLYIHIYIFSWYSANRVIEKYQTPREGCICRGEWYVDFPQLSGFSRCSEHVCDYPEEKGANWQSADQKNNFKLKNFSLFLLSYFPGNILRFLLKRDELEHAGFFTGVETMDGCSRWIRCYSALPSMLVKMHSNGH